MRDSVGPYQFFDRPFSGNQEGWEVCENDPIFPVIELFTVRQIFDLPSKSFIIF